MTRFGLENKILERQRGWEDQGGKEQELIQLSIGLFMVKKWKVQQNEKYTSKRASMAWRPAWLSVYKARSICGVNARVTLVESLA